MMGEGTVNDEELVEVIARRFARIDRLWAATATSCSESDPCYSCRHRAKAAVEEIRLIFDATVADSGGSG